jgi:hypothetical protein
MCAPATFNQPENLHPGVFTWDKNPPPVFLPPDEKPAARKNAYPGKNPRQTLWDFFHPVAFISHLKSIFACVKELSGAQWVNRFPTSQSIEELSGTFKDNMQSFYDALITAGANVQIAATHRPSERAFLMHWSYRIAKENYRPEEVPEKEGVNINWWHGDLASSKAAAAEMVQGYQVVFRPSLISNHIRGTAIDMEISWQGTLTINNVNGRSVSISTGSHDNTNETLQQVAATYGVLKHSTDFPHWSHNGR